MRSDCCWERLRGVLIMMDAILVGEAFSEWLEQREQMRQSMVADRSTI